MEYSIVLFETHKTVKGIDACTTMRFVGTNIHIHKVNSGRLVANTVILGTVWCHATSVHITVLPI